MASAFDPYAGMLAAKRRVEKSRALNAAIFARYAAEPIIVSASEPQCERRQHEILARIAPWLPKQIPHWMRPV